MSPKRGNAEKMLEQTFWELLEKKSFDKITVKDLVEACGVNRNTFYYHFQDMQDLLERALSSKGTAIIESQPVLRSPLDFFIPLAEGCVKDKKAIRNIVGSAREDLFRNYMGGFFATCAERLAENYNDDWNSLSDEQKSWSIWMGKCFMSGLFTDWIWSGMNYDLIEYMRTSLVHLRESGIVHLDADKHE